MPTVSDCRCCRVRTSPSFPGSWLSSSARDLDDVLIFGGGVIPDADIDVLKEQGVAEIFGPGSSLRAIGEWLEHVPRRT